MKMIPRKRRQAASFSRTPLLGALLCAALFGACGGDEDNNAPPVFSPLPAEYRVTVGESVNLNVVATDPDGDKVSLSLAEAPNGAEFISPSGLGRFFWAPLASDASGGGTPHDVVFRARDDQGKSSTLRTTIVVDPSDGAPRFVTSPQRVLDLSVADSLLVEVAVKDDDSSLVELSLEKAPKGMELIQNEEKRAELRWTPSPEQIAEQTVWGATILADDQSSGPVFQELSVILLTKKSCDDGGACGCAPPTIAHDELPDQRGIDDYIVTASAEDEESEVQKMTLFWTLGDPEDRSNFTAVEMTQEGDQFTGTIPNPLLENDDNAPIYYFLCAQDNDDPQGDQCDGLTCAPVEGVNTFTAFPAGDETSCREDELEPNETPINSASILTDSILNLNLCEGDVDVLSFNLNLGDSFSAQIGYTAANGNISAKILGPSLEEIDAVDTEEDDEFVFVSSAQESGEHYLVIEGEPNNYSVVSQLTPAGDNTCLADFLEPNDVPEEASGSSSLLNDLSICPNDTDYFLVTLNPGDTVDMGISFTHEDGDLDLFFREAGATTNLKESTSITNNEELSHTHNGPEATDYYLFVLGFDGASNNYNLLIDVTPAQTQACTNDNHEPNNEIATAHPLDEVADAYICPGDEDFYAFDLNQGEHARVEMLFGDSGPTDLDLQILNANGETLDSSTGTGNEEVSHYTATEAGTYYARAFGYQNNEGAYVITLDKCPNDDQEPNDLSLNARPIAGTNTDLNLCLGETDWYSVNLFEDSLLSIDMRAEPEDLEELEMILYASDGTTVLDRGVANEAQNQLSVFFENNEAETVLLRIRTTRGGAAPSYPYSLIVQIL